METRVADYDAWLEREAWRVSGDLGSHDDLVQEGRIAMWRAEAKLDTGLGSAASWLTRAAEMRMRDLAWGHGQPFGREATRGKREVQPAFSVDSLDENVRESMEPAAADLADQLVLAYHRGEIKQALDRLSPTQRAAAVKIFTDGVLTPSERACWTVARRKLQAELADLR